MFAMYKLKRHLSNGSRTVGVMLTLFFIVFPIFWLVLTSFKNLRDAFSTKLFFEPSLDNYSRLFAHPWNFEPMVLNSIIISTTTVLIAVPLATMAAFAFSRYRFRGQDLLLVSVLASQFLPGVVIILPYFIQFRNLGLLDTRTGLIIVNLSFAIPFATWLLKGFIDSVPIQIEESALVDGCSEWQVLRHVTVPLLKPGLITAAVFTFITSWNEFLFAFILTKDRAAPMIVGLRGLVETRGVPWELLSAAGVLIMLPIFLMSLSIRRHFVQGLTMGAVKE